MHHLDIRKYKSELRELYKKSRSEMDHDRKTLLDKQITENVLKLYQYKNADIILIYVSTPIEVGTRDIIEKAWADGKKVAVPRCIPRTREMEFHYINSFDELKPGTFSVLEPSADLPIITDYTSSLMIIPALSIDNFGYRLGYGKGYYDRYLVRFTGQTAGICYSENLRRHMFHGRYDCPVDVVVTENGIKRIKK